MIVLRVFLFSLVLIPTACINIFGKNTLRDENFGKSVLIIDVCIKCDFQWEVRRIFKSQMSVIQLRYPQTLDNIPTDSVYTFVVIVTDYDYSTFVSIFGAPRIITIGCKNYIPIFFIRFFPHQKFAKLLQESSIITATTKVLICIKTIDFLNTTAISNILQGFTDVRLLNVVAMLGTFVHYQTLHLDGVTLLTEKNISEVPSIENIYPNKIKNVHGHSLKVVEMHTPPYSVIVRDPDGTYHLDGTHQYLLEIFLKRINATYELKLAMDTYDVLESYENGHGDLCLNKFSPFWKEIFGKTDFINTLETDSFRIMVRSIRQNNVTRDRFLTVEVWVNFIALMGVSLLYSSLFDRPRRRYLANCFHFLEILLQMPVIMKLRRASSRLFMGSIYLFCLVQSVNINTSITCQLVNYLPDSGIHTVEDILKANISIYGNTYSVSVIKSVDMQLDRTFVQRIQAVDYFPWNLETKEEFAYVANTAISKHFIDSAVYNDPHDKQRFLLFPRELVKYPVLFVLPKNSPLTSELQLVYMLAEQAGLIERWSVMKLSLMEDWSYFKPSSYSKVKAEEYLNVGFAFIYIAVGQCFSLVAFVVENIIGRRWYKPRRTNG